MKVLHPCGEGREAEKRPNWAFVRSIRPKVKVIDRLVTGPNGYYNFIASEWGTDDLINLEDDKVPTMEDFDELAACKEPWCVVPYQPAGYYGLTLTYDDWVNRFPFGLGFTKFTLGAQKSVPVADWDTRYHHVTGDPHQGEYMIDRVIEIPMIARVGKPHIHPRFVKHNHA